MAACKNDDCKKQAVYGIRGTCLAIFCKMHKLAGYVNVRAKHCIHSNCETRAICGSPGTKKALYCKTHKLAGHVDLINKKCVHDNCNTQPAYGVPGTKKTLYCKTHKLAGHVDLMNKRCIQANCNKQTAYGLPGTKTALYCRTHKPAEYVNVISKKCIHSNCDKIPAYGVPGTKIKLYCRTHKLAEHVDLMNKRCIYSNCTTAAVYGLTGTKIKLYCKIHKLAEHVDLMNKRCIYIDCNKQPNFGIPGTKVALYCRLHKLIDHINVMIKKCIYTDCITGASYGKPGYSKEYCSDHKLLGMVLNPTKVKTDEYKTCDICCSKIHYNDKVCKGCDKFLKTGTTVKTKTKELAVKALLDKYEIKYVHDKASGESRKRPDFQIPTKWGKIILEVDEHQHIRTNYSCECEITRMKQIYFDLNQENLLFIRYNPDNYKFIAGKQETQLQREDFLHRYITERMASIDNFKHLGVVYLYYDGFIKEAEIEKINPYEVNPNIEIVSINGIFAQIKCKKCNQTDSFLVEDLSSITCTLC